MQQTFKKYQLLQPTQVSDIMNDLDHKLMAAGCTEDVMKCLGLPVCPPSVPCSETVTKIIRADWNATSGEGLILNKPDLNLYATKEYVNEKIAHLPSGGGAVLSDWEETDEMSYAYILNKPELHTAMTNEEIENLLN